MKIILCLLLMLMLAGCIPIGLRTSNLYAQAPQSAQPPSSLRFPPESPAPTARRPRFAAVSTDTRAVRHQSCIRFRRFAARTAYRNRNERDDTTAPALPDRAAPEARGHGDGKVANYIPELAKADPDAFGICIVTADGYVYEIGDYDREFTMQSVSKPAVYAAGWRIEAARASCARWASSRAGRPSIRSASIPKPVHRSIP